MKILKVKDWQKINKEQFKSFFLAGVFNFSHAIRYKDGQEFRCGDIVIPYDGAYNICEVVMFNSDNIHIHLKDVKNTFGSNIYDYFVEINNVVWLSSK